MSKLRKIFWTLFIIVSLGVAVFLLWGFYFKVDFKTEAETAIEKPRTFARKILPDFLGDYLIKRPCIPQIVDGELFAGCDPMSDSEFDQHKTRIKLCEKTGGVWAEELYFCNCPEKKAGVAYEFKEGQGCVRALSEKEKREECLKSGGGIVDSFIPEDPPGTFSCIHLSDTTSKTNTETSILDGLELLTKRPDILSQRTKISSGIDSSADLQLKASGSWNLRPDNKQIYFPSDSSTVHLFVKFKSKDVNKTEEEKKLDQLGIKLVWGANAPKAVWIVSVDRQAIKNFTKAGNIVAFSNIYPEDKISTSVNTKQDEVAVNVLFQADTNPYQVRYFAKKYGLDMANYEAIDQTLQYLGGVVKTKDLPALLSEDIVIWVEAPGKIVPL